MSIRQNRDHKQIHTGRDYVNDTRMYLVVCELMTVRFVFSTFVYYLSMSFLKSYIYIYIYIYTHTHTHWLA